MTVKYVWKGLGNTQEIDKLYINGELIESLKDASWHMVLTEFGADNWEMTGVVDNSASSGTSNSATLFFKRPVKVEQI